MDAIRRLVVSMMGSRLARDTRGAAFAEALVMMPAFILLFAGVGFFHHYYTARMNAAETARRCAWAYSNGGCDQVPGGCAGVVGGQDAGGAPRASSGDIAEAQTQIDRITSGVAVPGLDSIRRAILGTATTATGRESVPIPDVARGGRRDATCRYTVVCNERERTLASIVRDAFCAKANSLGIGGVLGC